MSAKQEDLLFKDVGEEEVDVLLKRINLKSKKKKLNPTEIRYIDPTMLIADIIIELDDIILIIEFQSTLVDTDVEPPRRVDDGDSQTKNFFTKPKKNAFILILFFGNFYCPVVPTSSRPLLRILILALTSRS